jgi:hypothetical protein
MPFSVTGHYGQNQKMVDLSLKINFLTKFSVQISVSEVKIKKYAQVQELLIF